MESDAYSTYDPAEDEDDELEDDLGPEGQGDASGPSRIPAEREYLQERQKKQERMKLWEAARSSAPHGLDAKAWNEQLVEDGHTALRDHDDRSSSPVGRSASFADNLFYGEQGDEGSNAETAVTIGEEPRVSRSSGKKKAVGRAVKVRRPGEPNTYRDIGNDTAAITDWLGPLEGFELALRQGRRSPAADKKRAELVRKVAELIGMDAHQGAIAEVLGCRDKTVRTLAQEGEAN